VLREGKSNRLIEELQRVFTELETLVTHPGARATSLP
jgi:hypothetical protein